MSANSRSTITTQKASAVTTSARNNNTKKKKEKKTWEDQFQELVKFKETFGHCKVPRHYTENTSLGLWVIHQRNGKPIPLTEEQRRRLDELGFGWETTTQRFDRLWDERYQRLLVYRAENGDCIVPQHYEDDRDLGAWVSTQRITHRKGRLAPERQAKLEAIDFHWGEGRPDRDNSHNEKKWMEQYKRLVAFRKTHGHCLVSTTPATKKVVGHLGIWVTKQRIAYSKGGMPEHRKELLDRVDFVYRVESTDADTLHFEMQTWAKKYSELLDYKLENGNLDNITLEQPKISRWLERQRIQHRENCLNPEHSNKLAKILGSDWASEKHSLSKEQLVSRMGKRSGEKTHTNKNPRKRKQVPKDNPFQKPFPELQSPSRALTNKKPKRGKTIQDTNASLSNRHSNQDHAASEAFTMNYRVGTRVRKVNACAILDLSLSCF